MRLVSVHNLKPGMKLGITIYDSKGYALLSAGTVLNQSFIERLRSLGIAQVYIDDVLGEGIEIKELISSHLKLDLIRLVRSTYDNLKEAREKRNLKLEELGELVPRDRFARLINDVIDELIANRDLLIASVDPRELPDYPYLHPVSTTIIALATALKMGFTIKDMFSLGMGAIFMDLGMMFIDSEIITKPSALTPEEWQKVKEHPSIGFQIIRRTPMIDSISAGVVLQHHERLDGSGYPKRIKGSEVMRHVRIAMVADVFDALISKRPWREPKTFFEALNILKQEAAKGKLDAGVVNFFSQLVVPYPVGSGVMLSNGDIGIVASINKENLSKPVVKVVWKMDGSMYPSPFMVNLLHEKKLIIVKPLPELPA